MIRRTLLSAAIAMALLPVPVQAHDDHPAGLHVHDPYARTMGRVGTSGAVFFLLHNNTETDDRLIAAASDAAEVVELHTHVDENGVMRMTRIEGGIALPAGQMHALERGADHVMLMGLTRNLAPGDIVTVTLTFESGAELVIEAPVDNARDGAAPDHSGHGTGHGAGHGMNHGG